VTRLPIRKSHFGRVLTSDRRYRVYERLRLPWLRDAVAKLHNNVLCALWTLRVTRECRCKSNTDAELTLISLILLRR
jgi:hypothetical protein